MSKYKILYVEDNRTDFEMVKAVLEDQGLVDMMYRVDKREEFFLTLENQKIDIILTDYSIPAFHGMEVVQIARERYPYVPIIMVTGNLSDEIAVDIIKKGAWDYVLKENVYRLIPAIQSCMDRKKMKQEKDVALETLSESETAYRLLAESSPYGILVHVRGRVFYHNRQAMRMITGKEKGSFLGLKLKEFIHPDHRESLESRIKRIYSGERIEEVEELKFVNLEGEELLLEIASSPITFHGYPAGQVIFKDIAERKRAEQELIRAKERAEESDRLKTAFLENMSHEIRTPLNGIIGFASLLKLKDITEEDKLSYISIIEESGKHLLNIIDDLIEVSRIESGQMELRREVFNLNELLDELYVFYNEGDKYKDRPVQLKLQQNLSSEETNIYADKSRIRQVFINLLNNAFKFTDEGKIEFGYEVLDKAKLRFFVKDTGCGIPEESQDLIFERFRQARNASQRSAGGNGLGLTICKGIVTAMNGRIWVESEEDKGTHFYFEIQFDKASDAIPESRANQKISANYNWKDKTLLIAEDEISNFQLLQEILSGTEIRLLHAKTGTEAINLVREDDQIDMILMDIKMPELNGKEATRILRKNNIKIPIIAQTAFAMSEDEKKCMEAGCNGYLTKPIHPDELLTKMSLFFNGTKD